MTSEGGSPENVLLHGTLQVAILSAENLPNTDTALFINKKNKSDPYVTLEAGKNRLAKTRVIDDDLNPQWNEYFRIDIAQVVDKLVFSIRDKDLVGAERIGCVEIPASQLLEGRKRVVGWQNILKRSGDSDSLIKGARLNVSVKFYFFDEVTAAREIPKCYFASSPDNLVTLFQDAHTPDNPLFSSIKLAGDRPYKPRSAWACVSEAINNAKIFIYMSGWSVDNSTTLLRNGKSPSSNERLGELLMRKANEGVRVLLLIWDDKLSTDVLDGLGTHDNKTEKFFKGSNVRVALVPRQKRFSTLLNHTWASTCYSHHQKTIIVDSAIPQKLSTVSNAGKRRLVAFVGGLDVTLGRWDDQQHALFSTLTTTHADDFYNVCFNVDQSHGPRQPWHDVHSMIEGPAARDVLQNFTERWRRQVKNDDPNLVDNRGADFDFQCPGPVANDADKWQVQVLRTINSDSAKFSKEDNSFLYSLKGRRTEDSIQRGYVHHIRRAQRFIYIENQYFLGSSHLWLDDAHYKARTMIPYEIAKAICRKIAEGKRFAVYIVMPLFPEGDPSSAALQAILHAQYRTMEMMYRNVGDAIKAAGIKDASPSDYLMFFCLGNREQSVPSDLATPPADSEAAKLRASRRHQIYVHSKMMIVDDEVAIVGSANINQRSMAGNRDTEIAICAFQPGRIEKTALTKGDVYGLRMALWAEHTGKVLPEFEDPSSLKCARIMNDIGEMNLCYYASEEVTSLEGHLMLYPLSVNQQGSVSVYPDFSTFPDTEASIVGEKSSVIPLSVTT